LALVVLEERKTEEIPFLTQLLLVHQRVGLLLMAADQAAITLAQPLKAEVLAVLGIAETYLRREFPAKETQAQLVAALTQVVVAEQETLVFMQVKMDMVAPEVKELDLILLEQE
jgi:hypothetical protein